MHIMDLEFILPKSDRNHTILYPKLREANYGSLGAGPQKSPTGNVCTETTGYEAHFKSFN